MRRSPVPGAGAPVIRSRIPEPTQPIKRKRSPSDQRRDAARAARHTLEQIHAKAHERHEAWVDGEQRNVVASLTTDLDELFDDRRGDQAGTLRLNDFAGRTMHTGRGA